MIIQPDGGRGPWLQLLDGARERLLLVSYRLSDPPTLEALERSRRREVRARVLLHYSDANQGARERLRAAGVEVGWGNRHYPLTHQKTLVVDRTAWILTHNLTRVSFEENRGFALAVNDPQAVQEIVAVFEADWARQRVRPGHPDLVWVPGQARERIVELVAGTRESVEVTNEHMEDQPIEDALIAAARRHVKVRVLMSTLDPGRDRNDRGRQRLRDGGVEVRLLERPFVHAKVLRLDGRAALVGSINISRAALDKNRELSAVTRDPRGLAELGRVFEEDWARAR